MGLTPLARVPRRRTRLDVARDAYLGDRIDVGEFEKLAGELIAAGIADEQFVPEPGGLPPKPPDAARSARPPGDVNDFQVFESRPFGVEPAAEVIE